MRSITGIGAAACRDDPGGPVRPARRLFRYSGTRPRRRSRRSADGAQSFGASVAGRRVGTFGNVTAMSFFPAKPLGCYGDGGAIFTDDGDLAGILRSLRVHGQGDGKYDNVRIGLNGRLDTIQAAILLQKLDIFDEEISAREEVAQRYTRLLEGFVGVPAIGAGITSAWGQYTVIVEDRIRVWARLAESRIPSAVYYPKPLHQQPAYATGLISNDRLPLPKAWPTRASVLPMHPYITEEDQSRVADVLRQA